MSAKTNIRTQNHYRSNVNYSPMLQHKKQSYQEQNTFQSLRKDYSRDSESIQDLDAQQIEYSEDRVTDTNGNGSEHYFTASFQNMCSNNFSQNHTTNQNCETNADRDNVDEGCELEDTIIIEEQSTTIHTHQSTNPKINSSINPKLLNSRSTNTLSVANTSETKDYQESMPSTKARHFQQDSLSMIGEEESFDSLKKGLHNTSNHKFLTVSKPDLATQSLSKSHSDINISQNTNKFTYQSSMNVSRRESPNRKQKLGIYGNNYYQERIDKINVIQDKFKTKIRDYSNDKTQHKYETSNVSSYSKGQSLTPRFDKFNTNGNNNDLFDKFDENITESEEEKIIDEINSKTNYQRKPITPNHNFDSHYKTQNQSYNTNNKNQFQSQQSLLSTGQGYFNKSDDQLLGNLSNFVETRMSAMNVMIQEKRKLTLLIEERKGLLAKFKLDQQNQIKQQELFEQEIKMNIQKKQSVTEQNSDLEWNIKIFRDKIKEKGIEYKEQVKDLEYSYHSYKQEYQQQELSFQQYKEQNQQIKQQRIQELEYLKDQNKQTDTILTDMKEHRNLAAATEKNRVQYLKEKGCNLEKLIQDDRMFGQKTNIRDIQQNQQRTRNHRFNKLELSTQSKSIERTVNSSASTQCKTPRLVPSNIHNLKNFQQVQTNKKATEQRSVVRKISVIANSTFEESQHVEQTLKITSDNKEDINGKQSSKMHQFKGSQMKGSIIDINKKHQYEKQVPNASSHQMQKNNLRTVQSNKNYKEDSSKSLAKVNLTNKDSKTAYATVNLF